MLLVCLFARRDQWAILTNWQAQRCLHDGRYAEAEDWLDKSSWLSPRNAETQLLIARVARRQGKMSDVRRHLAAARSLGLAETRVQREHWMALAQDGQMSEASPHLSEMLLSPDDDAEEILLAFVVGYLKTQKIGRANQLLDAWAAEFPNTATPHFLRGVISQDNLEWNTGIEHFQKAFALDASHPRVALHLAHCLQSNRQHEEALPYFDIASRIPLVAAEATVGKSVCLSEIGRSNEAAHLLRSLLKRQPGNREAALELARLEVADGDYEQAVQRLKPIHERDPRDYDVRYALATALRGAGHTDEASRHFDAISLAREQLQRAEILSEEVDPNIETRFEIGTIYLQFGEQTKGVFWLRSLLDDFPGHTPTHKALADYYESKSDEDASFRTLANFHRESTNRTSSAGNARP